MARGWLRIVVVGLIAATAWVSSTLAQETLAGTEFQANVRTQDYQSLPAIAAEDNGDFVVIWHSGLPDNSPGQDGSLYGIFGRRITNTGAAIGTEFQVNSYTFGQQAYPSVATDFDGDFVVVWQSDGQGGGYYLDIIGRQFSSAGVALGSDFQINVNDFTFNQSRPRVAAADNGDFVVVWHSEYQDGSYTGVFGQRFSSAGVALGGEFQVNVYTYSAQKYPSVSAAANGDFVVSWQSDGQDPFYYDVFARQFSSSGAPLSGEILVNTYTPESQAHPSVSADTNGNFIVAWESRGQDGGIHNDVFAQRFSSAGAPLGGEFPVPTYVTGNQEIASVSADRDGDFVISWHSDGQAGYYFDVFARRFTSAGVAEGVEFQVNTTTLYGQSFAGATRDADGDFVVAWQSYGQDDTDSMGIFLQRYSVPATLDIDGNGIVDALTDGLLIVRYTFGFTGDTLTIGAVGMGCTRCTDVEISAYIDSLGLAIDVDGDGTVQPLTDGIVLLRHMFGFTGLTLIIAAIDPDCTRCTVEPIVFFLTGLS